MALAVGPSAAPVVPSRQGTLRMIMPSTTPPTELPPFGWYPDPAGTGMLRWWDGSSWTNDLERFRPEVQAAPQFSTLLAS